MTAESDKAVALRYTEDLPAPMVVASGRGAVAQAITRIARESGVPLVADEALAASLLELDVNELIPESLYAVIAEILVFIGRVRTAQ
ncbi:MAG TPA: EscU/YscU/HrcU family type III secretion system export apparatus switch protein [Spirochaetia bacterium]